MGALATIAGKDGFDQYMSEVRKIPLLSREDEQALAIEWRDEGSLEAAHKLVTSNLRFVAKVALEYKSYGVRILDLVQEGNIGLMHAVRKFDPDRGYRLITYAVWWIRAYIQSYLLKGHSLVKLGTTQAQRRLFFRLPAARAQLDKDPALRELTGEDRTAALAESLNVKPKELEQFEMRTAARDFSLDLALDESGDTTHLDLLEGDAPAQDSLVAANEIRDGLRKDLAAALDSLDEREREVIVLRYLSDESVTLREVGAKWGVSRERARQIEARARDKLKAALLAGSAVIKDALDFDDAALFSPA